MKARLDRDGHRTTLSDKQYKKLMQLSGASRGSAPQRRPAKAATQSQSKTNTGARIRRAGIRTPRRRHRRRSSYRQVKNVMWIVMAAFGALAMLSGQFDPQGTTSSTPQEITRSLTARQITVVDGDTITVRGMNGSIRLVGFNTPETFEPRCDAGLRLGRKATSRLNQLVRQAASIELEMVRCACPPGTQGTQDCNYGRSCGHLNVDGRDVGGILIAEGLAARFICGRTSCPPTPRPWCPG